MRLIKLFNEHPNSIGMSYAAHFFRAMGFVLLLTYAATVCLIHAIFPFIFEHTASNIVSFLYDEMRG
jgi:hypothetical protein